MNKVILYDFVILSDSEYGYNCFISCVYDEKRYHFQCFLDDYDIKDSIINIIIQEIKNYERYNNDK